MVTLNNSLIKLGKLVAVNLFILQVVIAVIPHISADNINPGVFSVNSKPHGFTYSEWSAKFWTWLLEIPSSVNPINDDTGEQCARNQEGPMWFLIGGPLPAERYCIVPQDKALFIPTFTTECAFAEDASLHTEEQLRSCALNSNQGGVAEVIVDGVSLKDLEDYRVQSPLFNFTFPQDNSFGAPPGPTQAVSDGIFIILEPLSPGNHTIHAKGVVLGNPVLGTQGFISEANYRLTVK